MLCLALCITRLQVGAPTRTYSVDKEYLQLAELGDLAGANRVREELASLRQVWSAIYEGLWHHQKAVHPMGLIKYWMDLLGMVGGPVAPPMEQVSDETKKAFRQDLDATGWTSLLFPER